MPGHASIDPRSRFDVLLDHARRRRSRHGGRHGSRRHHRFKTCLIDRGLQYHAGLSSWSADFKQTITDGHGKRELRSGAGKFNLQRPGKFRWDYSEPSEQLVLADGKQVWFYDKDLAQANVRDLDATLASTPAMLLSGSGSVSNQFDITALPNDAAGLRWFQLVPKRPNTDFQLVRIGFRQGRASSRPCSSRTSSIRSRSLSFTQSSDGKNPKFAAGSALRCTPPPGVDVIGRDAK